MNNFHKLKALLQAGDPKAQRQMNSIPVAEMTDTEIDRLRHERGYEIKRLPDLSVAVLQKYPRKWTIYLGVSLTEPWTTRSFDFEIRSWAVKGFERLQSRWDVPEGHSESQGLPFN